MLSQRRRKVYHAGRRFEDFSRESRVQVEAALAFASAGDRAKTETLIQDLMQRFSLDTQTQSLWIPAISRSSRTGSKKSGIRPEGSRTRRCATRMRNNRLWRQCVRIVAVSHLCSGQCLPCCGTQTRPQPSSRRFSTITVLSGIAGGELFRNLGVGRVNALQARTSQGADISIFLKHLEMVAAVGLELHRSIDRTQVIDYARRLIRQIRYNRRTEVHARYTASLYFFFLLLRLRGPHFRRSLGYLRSEVLRCMAGIVGDDAL